MEVIETQNAGRFRLPADAPADFESYFTGVSKLLDKAEREAEKHRAELEAREAILRRPFETGLKEELTEALRDSMPVIGPETLPAESVGEFGAAVVRLSALIGGRPARTLNGQDWHKVWAAVDQSSPAQICAFAQVAAQNNEFQPKERPRLRPYDIGLSESYFLAVGKPERASAMLECERRLEIFEAITKDYLLGRRRG